VVSLDFDEALGSGVSRGVGLGVVFSSSSDFFLPALLCEGGGGSSASCDAYRRWSTFLLLPLPCGIGVGDFFSFGEALFSFATLRLLILHEESRLVPFPGLQKQVFFFRFVLDAFATGLGDFLGLGTAKHASGFARFAPAFFFATGPVVEEIATIAAHRRAQLRAKCGSAPLRRTVTERATRQRIVKKS